MGDITFPTLVAIGLYLLATVLGIGLVAYAALVEPKPKKPYRWGDPRRRHVPGWVSNTIGAILATGAVLVTEALMRGGLP